MRVATFLLVAGLVLTTVGLIFGLAAGQGMSPWLVLAGAILVYVGAVMELTGC